MRLFGKMSTCCFLYGVSYTRVVTIWANSKTRKILKSFSFDRNSSPSFSGLPSTVFMFLPADSEQKNKVRKISEFSYLAYGQM